MPRKKVIRRVPNFSSEDEERSFWAQNDSSEYVDWDKAIQVNVPNLKPSTRTISIRLPETLIENLKLLANKRDVHYQSLLKIFVAERVQEELRHE
ncbi:MAG: BrnA antitoxin family protein [Deltaproteobacteria bacterium]|jgi:predicted DNA binding CopG/RHH family protein|nr:BrnA antitoxin family protein [Deltaproteobacteria bacterium]